MGCENREVVRLGTSDKSVIQFQEGSSNPNLASVTRAVLELDDGSIIDSDVDAAAFDFSQMATGILTLILGGTLAVTLTPGVYWSKIMTYDPGHPNGLTWWDYETDPALAAVFQLV